MGVTSISRRAVVWGVLCLSVVGTSLFAEQAGQDPLTPLLGQWTLDRDAGRSDITTSTDDAPRGRGGPGGGRRGGGFGGGFGVGLPGLGGRGAQPETPEERAAQRAEADRVAALMQEVLAPSSAWTIAREVGGMVALTDGDGRTARYTPNDKVEKHQLRNGTIETRTKWSNGTLQQVLMPVKGRSLTRTFAFDAALDALVVTLTPPGGRGGEGRPVTMVYADHEQ